MKDRCILPESLCASSGQLVHTIMWRHVFLEAVFPKIVQFVQFPCVIDVNYMIFTICTSLLYSCFVFCFEFVLYTLFQTTFYVFHVISCIHINTTDYHARDLHFMSISVMMSSSSGFCFTPVGGTPLCLLSSNIDLRQHGSSLDL